MISQEEFARQLQLSDPQTVAGVFSYFQKVKELGCNMQSSGFKDVRVAMSFSLDGQFGVRTGYPNSCCQMAHLLRSAGGFYFYIEYPEQCFNHYGEEQWRKSVSEVHKFLKPL